MSYKYAVVFPGQGAQYEGMSKDIINSDLPERENFLNLVEIIDRNKANKILNALKDDISKTEIAQLSIFLNSISLFEIFRKKNPDIKISGTAGLSLGEYSSLYASGAINLNDAIKLIDRRGDIMSKNASGKGTMVAAMKSSPDEIDKIIKKIKETKNGVLSICNLNCPGQTVIGGEFDMIDIFKDECKNYEIKKVIQLDVEGPFHTEILKEASEEFYEYMKSVKFQELKFDVYTNLTGQKYENSTIIKDTLKRQMYSPVKFELIIKNMIDEGFNRFIEIGPGNTLKGFIKKIDKNIEVFNIQSLDDIQNGGINE